MATIVVISKRESGTQISNKCLIFFDHYIILIFETSYVSHYKNKSL